MATKKELALQLSDAREEVESLRKAMEDLEEQCQKDKDDFEDEMKQKYVVCMIVSLCVANHCSHIIKVSDHFDQRISHNQTILS